MQKKRKKKICKKDFKNEIESKKKKKDCKMQKKTLVQEQTMLQFLKYFFVESTITFRIYLYLLVKSNELSNNKIVNQIVD